MFKFFISIFFLFFISVSNAKNLEIDINSGQVEPLPIAIADFTDRSGKSNSLGRSISSVITNNLIGSGQFTALETAAFIAPPTSPSVKPNFNDWKPFGIKALVTGAIKAEKNNKIEVEFRLWDVVSEKYIEGLRLSINKESWRRISHIISDVTFERLTGDKGYFDTKIVYISESGPPNARKKRLAIMDQDGENHEFLTDGNFLILTPRFSPNTQEITYLSYYNNEPRVYIRNLFTGEQEMLGSFPGMTFAPRFSPDGKKIIMSFAKDGNSDIYTMDLENRIVEKITNHPSIDTSPSYSPDGKYIAFNSDRSGYQQIYVMNSNGKNVKRISFGKGLYGTPVWSPRGDLIAFTKLHKGKFYIGVMRTDGKGERLLTENFYQEAPSWSPNGRVLIFYRETKTDSKGKGFSAKLWSIDLTGYNERLITTPTDASDPSWSSLLSN